MIGHWQRPFYGLTFATGATITIDSSTTSRILVHHTCTINGAVVLNNRLSVTADGDFVINSGASFSGASYLYSNNNNSGHGFITLHSSVTTPEIRFWSSSAGVRLVAGTYAGLVKLWTSEGVSNLLELDNATYNFNGGLELENLNTGVVTLQNKTNVPTINVTDLTIDTNSTGTCVIDDSGQSVDWTITGDVIDQRTGDTFTWTKGTGTITASGSASQNWDWMGESIEDLVIDKSAGTLTLSGPVTTDSFTGTSTGTGDFDPNGQTITITGNCSWAAAFDFNTAADTMNGCTWVVGGNFTADGQTLKATAVWYLQVSGTAVASGTGAVAYSDAGVGTYTMIDAFSGPWTDNGNNLNWDFIPSVSNLRIGGDILGWEPCIQLLPDKHVNILI
jgi:hypothetical protein